MLKKIISLMIIFAMLVPLSSAVAADEPTSQPTIEEILNGYHEKAFAAQTAGENDGASTYSLRSGSEKTLEQETVEELTAAGYEAYNVTGENYESLQASLQTDLSELGIDPEGSYIVVISGEGETVGTNSSRSSDVTLPPHTEDEAGYGGGGPGFLYEYKGRTYQLRYMTVTAADNHYYGQTVSGSLLEEAKEINILANVLNAVASAFLDKISGELYIGTIASICGLDATDFFTPYAETSFETFYMEASANWTRVFTQVYSTGYSEWYTTLHVEYVNTLTGFGGRYYSSANNKYADVPSNTKEATAYSAYYFDSNWRKENAVKMFKSGKVYYDFTGPIEFTYNGKVVFTIYENF